MASFEAKIFWNRPRNRENKNFRSVSLPPKGNKKLQKNREKFQKIKKHNYGILLSQNRLEKAEK